jgi:hypothetical protein
MDLLEEITRNLLDNDGSQLDRILSIEEKPEGIYVTISRRNGRSAETYKRVEKLRATRASASESREFKRAKHGLQKGELLPFLAEAVEMLSCRGNRINHLEYYPSQGFIEAERRQGKKAYDLIYKVRKTTAYERVVCIG